MEPINDKYQGTTVFADRNIVDNVDEEGYWLYTNVKETCFFTFISSLLGNHRKSPEYVCTRAPFLTEAP